MSALAISPVLVPLATVVATALTAQRPRLQQVLSLGGVAVLLACALALLTRAAADQPIEAVFGGWGEPFGIAFVIDRVGAALVVITAIMGLAALLFLLSDADTQPRHPLLLPLMHGVLVGVGGAFATADLFNLYVWFEVMLICALGLFAIGGRTDQLDATFKYFVLNLLGTLLLLMAVGMVYAVTGHLNYGAIAQALPGAAPWPTALAFTGLLLAFLIKAGAFPLFAWLPASYHTLPAPVLALFAALLTKVGVYAVLRTLAGIFVTAPALLFEVLGWIAVATMLFGVLGAAYHWDMRRILAFHIISQIGYILLGVALASEAGQAASLFYTLHHIVVKANLFLIAAMVWRLTGSYDLRDIGGLYRHRPALGVLFLIPALSLVGIPPLSGFWAKLWVLQEALAQGRVAWTVAALLVSVLTLYSMMKIWMEAFWKPHPQPSWQPPAGADLRAAWAVTVGLALITLAIGAYPEALLAYSLAAAETLGGR
ncbi:Na+/H+ antiporter subunit D [Tepidimonas taiwanensis]|uniref:Na(+)/H(+) antiporter subunit D n=1 Tax=Tepidimonas taiwanensis TaxID=307486 RepID=A0A554X6J2_9BURK|nr:proton-conducting transporter membrane subunit [Tepidimonas taiwanensis]MCX7691925.1 proton-conducting transporter membrane subunit [Tepidimonas taiwanensis]TSE31376.1 Na(+)/H(+) antiporter subunit D [Tepidimonas taiwanensis]UBQ06109.1 Na+/H+ antiporter subunit D [Tepidimonas taiwanensis]